MISRDLEALLQETVQVHRSPDAKITQIEPVPMGENERGWSGSQIQRFRVHLQHHETLSLITKMMPLKERRVMDLLTELGHAHTPFSYCTDLETEGLVVTCLQDLGSHKICIPDGRTPTSAFSPWDGPVARSLVGIHLPNLGGQTDLSWLPRADEAYIEHFLVKEVWRAHWDKALRASAVFRSEYAAYTSLLEKSAERLKRTVAALWQEHTSLTLTHGEVHGEHVILYRDRPYLIDWGWSYYGPFYLDLPAYFTPQTVHHYREAMAEQGFHIPASDFAERFHEIGRYVGFKYLCSGIWLWEPGPTAETGRRLLLMLKWAIDGTWPERAFAVLPPAWSQLLAEHTAFISSA